MEGLAHLVGHQLADTLQVVTEGASVALDLDVPQLSHILVDNAVAVSEIDDVHVSKVLGKNSKFFVFMK